MSNSIYIYYTELVPQGSMQGDLAATSYRVKCFNSGQAQRVKYELLEDENLMHLTIVPAGGHAPARYAHIEAND